METYPRHVPRQDDLFSHSYTARQQLLHDAAEQVFTIQERFEQFHRAHPDVFAELVELARRWKAKGGGRWSIDAAFQVLRWERVMANLPDPNEVFKLNNTYRSRYARLIMRDCPDLGGIFELRELKS